MESRKKGNDAKKGYLSNIYIITVASQKPKLTIVELYYSLLLF